MKNIKKIICIALSMLLIAQIGVLAAGAADKDYTIVSPYEDVIWDGENAWGAYKGSLHTHSTYSDADETLVTMVKEHYNQGYDFLAFADHGTTGVAWNKAPSIVALYYYQLIIGNKFEHLTDEEFEAITSGTYNNRGKGMTCVTGANEFNYISLTKNHVNGYFITSKANAFPGGENEKGYTDALDYIDKAGGLSHINHPGDWLASNQNPEVVNDPAKVEFFGDLILKYDSCLGTEVFNERNGTTGYDRVLWDNLLMYTLPYGKTVIGFSNNDAHHTGTVDTSFNVFMMDENNMETIKETMQSGAFFMVTRMLRKNVVNEIGPEEEFDASNTELAYPMFNKLTVDGHKITVSVKDATQVQFIADGKVISKSAVDANGATVTLDLDTIEGAEDFLYVRVEALGEGGMTLSQALVIDDGSEKPDYEEVTRDCAGFFEYIYRSSKLCSIINELIALIKG
ncbi:MAG: hypothetical protein IJE93_09220 [Clostridia bacterium]|nr:hypothetical protein [Clostridia bacterium]